ncbi:hypothetical protein DYB36_007030 [Aphanomyces astaci]|uniref:HTH CENPB-type domain-containing protein n=1 Tax=Aphanomyces astaci TaxID=112090 RepID=A0A396ZTQ1_APHAT|nr:hypothetical protein DYB36_007030 [Aphanomyces astaci]
MSSKRKQYDQAAMEAAIEACDNGSSISAAAKLHHVPRTSLLRHLDQRRNDEPPQRPGPKPRVPPEVEKDLFIWIAKMQTKGRPPTQAYIVNKVNQLAKKLKRPAVSRHWYKNFQKRQPLLTTRMAQTINRSRNAVTSTNIEEFFTNLECVFTKPSANKVPSKLASKRPRSTRIQRRTQLTIALDDVDLSTQDSGSDGEDHDDAVPFLSLLGGQDVDIAAQSGMERAPCDDVVEMVEL